MFELASRLRHGPLRRALPWTAAGRFFRAVQRRTGVPSHVRKRIGSYGPFRLDGRFAFSDFGNWGRGHNAAFLACIEACRGRQTFFDVGAHVGLVTLPASQVLAPGGRVHAFEPGRDNGLFLRRHIELNGIVNVTVIPSLVGDAARRDVAFFEQEGDSGLNTTAASVLRVDATRSTREQITLDNYCDANGAAPDVIKIDVEGAEVAVLRGAAATLRRARPLIVLSVHPRHLLALNSSVAELEQLLPSLGYRAKHPDGSVAEHLAFGEYLVTPVEASG